MAYQINKKFASNTNYTLSGEKKAVFDTNSNDIIKSPINGTVSFKNNDTIKIKDSDGNQFIISNITPLQNLSDGTSVGASDTIGHAKGQIFLEIEGSGIVSSKQKVEDYLNYTAAAAAVTTAIPDGSTSNKPKIKPENQLWRTPIKQYYAPLSTGVNLINKAVTDIFGEETITDESLLEDIKRIKKLLK